MSQPFDLNGLTTLQKIILTTDGTVTELLSLCLAEPMQLVKLSEAVITLTQKNHSLEIAPGHLVIDRHILLQGVNSGRNWLYANSIIVPDRLPEPFRNDLLNSQQPLGKLWSKYQLETFKERLTLTREPVGNLAPYFQISPDTLLLCRTYRVRSNRVPIMLITEKFPETHFRGELE